MAGPTVNSHSGNTATGTNTVTVTAPAGISNNDLLVAACSCNGSTWNTPTGWTSYESLNSGAYVVFYKVANNESGNYTFTTAGNGGLAVIVLDITGNGGQTPEANSGSNNGTGMTGTALSVTTLGTNRLDVACFFCNSNPSSTVQGSLVEQLTETTPGCLVDVATLAQAAQGASGNQTTTFGTSVSWYATLLAVPPALASQALPSALAALQVEDSNRLATAGSPGAAQARSGPGHTPPPVGIPLPFVRSFDGFAHGVVSHPCEFEE